MSLPGQQPGAVQPAAAQQLPGGTAVVPGAGAVPGAIPGATGAPGAIPQQAGTANGMPTRYSFFNRAPVDPAGRFQGEGQTYR